MDRLMKIRTLKSESQRYVRYVPAAIVCMCVHKSRCLPTTRLRKLALISNKVISGYFRVVGRLVSSCVDASRTAHLGSTD